MKWNEDRTGGRFPRAFRRARWELPAAGRDGMPHDPHFLCGRRAELRDLRPASPTTYVLGLGSPLTGDNGFGPAVVNAFESQYVVGFDVEVADLDSPRLDLTPWLADAGHVVVVTTVKSNDPPATLTCQGKYELLRDAPLSGFGWRDPGVKETLLRLEFAGRAPAEITVIGVTPARIGMGLDLTPDVKAMVPAAVAAVVAALERSGALVGPRAGGAIARPWRRP